MRKSHTFSIGAAIDCVPAKFTRSPLHRGVWHTPTSRSALAAGRRADQKARGRPLEPAMATRTTEVVDLPLVHERGRPLPNRDRHAANRVHRRSHAGDWPFGSIGHIAYARVLAPHRDRRAVALDHLGHNTDGDVRRRG